MGLISKAYPAQRPSRLEILKRQEIKISNRPY
jgi:hypothetical protein